MLIVILATDGDFDFGAVQGSSVVTGDGVFGVLPPSVGDEELSRL